MSCMTDFFSSGSVIAFPPYLATTYFPAYSLMYGIAWVRISARTALVAWFMVSLLFGV